MQVAQLTYRPFEDKDLPAVLSLWEKFSGWGAITEKQFYEWYINTPFGQCIIIVATDETDEVFGQLAFVPTRVCLHGKELKALRLSAPILRSDIRQPDLRSLDHPAMMMVRKGIELSQEMGYHILYCLPAHGWVGLMKLLPQFGMHDIQIASYNCGAISLKDETIWNKCADNNFFITLTDNFNESYDKLWEDAANTLPVTCGIIRNSLRLQWKISQHLVIEVRTDDRLLGYAAYKKKEGLLVDIFARTTGDIENVLLASIKAMHYKNENRLPVSFEEIKCMLSPQAKVFLKEINYQPVNFQFAFACYPLQNSIDKNSIHPENWYIMPDD